MSAKGKPDAVDVELLAESVSAELAGLVLCLSRAAASRPDLVRGRLIVGPPTRPADEEGVASELAWWRQHGGFPLSEGEIVLGTHETSIRSRAGAQRVLIGFAIRAEALHTLAQLEAEWAVGVAAALVDAIRKEKLH